MRILALDLAQNRTGIARYDGTSLETWNIGKTTPIQLFELIRGEVSEGDVILIEEHVSFRNAKTTRILIELIGYVHWSFVCLGFEVIKLFPYKARKRMDDQYTDVPDDERDAALLIHEHIGDFEAMALVRRRNDEQKNIARKSTKRASRRKAVLDSAS